VWLSLPSRRSFKRWTDSRFVKNLTTATTKEFDVTPTDVPITGLTSDQVKIRSCNWGLGLPVSDDDHTKRSIAMEKRAVIRAPIFGIFLTLGMFPGTAHAQVTVGCPGGSGGTYTSITAALNAVGQIGPITFTVTGTCNENVSLNNARSLRFVAGPGGAKVVQPQDSNAFDISLSQDITLQNLEIVGTPGSIPGSGGSGASITELSDVHINGCNIHDNEGVGVGVDRASVLFLRNTTIHNNPGDGLDVSNNSSATAFGTTIQDNGSACPGGVGPCGQGVTVSGSSSVVFNQNSLIQNNGDHGIGVLGSSVALRNTTIQGHNINGVYLKHGGHLGINVSSLIQANGAGCPLDTSQLVSVSQACGGISATDNSTLDLRAGSISDNSGAGISLRQGATITSLIGVTVSNNSGDGIHLQWISIGNIGSGNTITGNTGASVFCDQRSLVIGDLTGLSNVKCPVGAP
jgi:parallel beta helix pectate lyase-like protein